MKLRHTRRKSRSVDLLFGSYDLAGNPHDHRASLLLY